MPLPRPHDGESQHDFISRCMRETRREFPDESQRAAVCYRQWRDRRRRHGAWMPLTGAWAILPEWLFASRDQLLALMEYPEHLQALELDAKSPALPELIQRTGNGVALIPLHGPMIKRASVFAMLFGFVGTDLVRAAVEEAGQDDEVHGIVLHIDSPGGHVAGIHELANAVHRIDTTRKPVVAYIEDLGASAAYWVASQARRIVASEMAEIGSIGTLAVVPDLSGMAARQGITVHTVTTGPYKGMGVPGTALTDDHLSEIQRRVDAVQAFFSRAVETGRQLSPPQLAAVSDGRVWIAQEARRLRLIDEVGSLDAAVRATSRLINVSRRAQTHEEIAKRRAAFLTLKENVNGPSSSGSADKTPGE